VVNVLAFNLALDELNATAPAPVPAQLPSTTARP